MMLRHADFILREQLDTSNDEGGMTVATLVRWEPARELASLQAEMSRLMNGVFDSNGRAAQDWVPAADVWETEEELVYALDLPGVGEDDITIELHDDTLTVTAQRERPRDSSERGFMRFERRFGSFSRSLAVPAGVTEDAVQADYRNGVLEVRVAKPAAPKPRRIKLGGGHPTIESTSEPD